MPLTLPFLHWQAIIDFAMLALAFYLLLRWARSARALRLSLVIVGLQAISLLTRQYDLYITSWILQAAAVLTAVVLVVVFQSEWRRAFMLLDSMILLWPEPAAVFNPSIRAIAKACFEMARARTGALLVLLRRDPVEELITAAVPLGARVSAELLVAIFQKTSPLHDGAVVVESDRIASANAVLPLTQRQDIPSYFGTRHRAAMGLAERSDALVVAVSEERGTVTLMQGRDILALATPEELIRQLQGSVVRPKAERRPLLARALAHWKSRAAALALAGLVWSLSFVAAGTTVRNVSVGIEFAGVSRGLDIGEQSAEFLDVQLRGAPWVMDALRLSRLTARFNLSGLKAGAYTLPVRKSIINLPPGVAIERIEPVRLSIRLAPAEE